MKLLTSTFFRTVGLLAILGLLSISAAAAKELRVVRPEFPEGTHWTVLEVTDPAALPALGPGWEGRTFWDLRLDPSQGRLVRWRVLTPIDVGLGKVAARVGADRALCAEDEAGGARLGCRLYRDAARGPDGPRALWTDVIGESMDRLGSSMGDGDALSTGSVYARGPVSGRGVAEGVVIVNDGPHEAVVLRESFQAAGEERLRYRFVSTTGESVALLEGPQPAHGRPFLPDRGEVLVSGGTRADDGMTIEYSRFSSALTPGVTGFLQYSLVDDTLLTTVNPAWTSITAATGISQTTVNYQPDPGDPASQQVLPEVWDFTGLSTVALDYRTFNSTRDEVAGSSCPTVCATKDQSATPPDGTWQAYLKIDTFEPLGTRFTRDIFMLNDNDTGANPSIDVPFVSQDEFNTDNWSQICFEQSAGGAERLLRFFQFTGANPASAVVGVGDSWGSGNWTACNPNNGLYLTAASICDPQCWPGCNIPIFVPGAQGQLSANRGLESAIIEDGWVHLPTGNYVPALLMLQETHLIAGTEFLGTCNVSPQREHFYDYFWLNSDYGLLASISSLTDTVGTMPANDWSALGNMTDGVDVTWGPFPPFQTEAEACLSGTWVGWSLPSDGSNPNTAPNIANYGYEVFWGNLTDPDALADPGTNPNHSPLLGNTGYLAAPAGSEPTSTVITGWGGASINITVATSLTYTDPDLADQRNYRSAVFYKVEENPATLNASTFRVGQAVVPFVTRGVTDLQLDWPAVAGAESYEIKIFDLDTGNLIPCPGGMDCTPTSNTTVHPGAVNDGNSYGYLAYARDYCGELSAD